MSTYNQTASGLIELHIDQSAERSLVFDMNIFNFMRFAYVEQIICNSPAFKRLKICCWLTWKWF